MEKDYMDISMPISRRIAEEIDAIVNKTNRTLGPKAESAQEDPPQDKSRDYSLTWNLESIYGEFDI
jgi:hypothetical protein